MCTRAIPAFAVPVTGRNLAMAGLSGACSAVEFISAIPVLANGARWQCLNRAVRRPRWRLIGTLESRYAKRAVTPLRSENLF